MADSRESHSLGTHEEADMHVLQGQAQGTLLPMFQGRMSSYCGEKHCMCKPRLSPNITSLFPRAEAPAWRLQVDVNGKRAGRAPE